MVTISNVEHKTFEYINSKKKTVEKNAFISVFRKRVTAGEFIILHGETNIVFLIIDITYNIENDIHNLEVNHCDVMTHNVNRKISSSSNVAKFIREIYQTSKCSVVTTNMCSNIAYVLYPTNITDGIHCSLVGIEHLYVARYQIQKNNENNNITTIIDEHITYPIRNNTQTNMEIDYKIKMNKEIKRLLSKRSMNQRLQGSSSIHFSNNEWNMLKNSLNLNVIQKKAHTILKN